MIVHGNVGRFKAKSSFSNNKKKKIYIFQRKSPQSQFFLLKNAKCIELHKTSVFNEINKIRNVRHTNLMS